MSHLLVCTTFRTGASPVSNYRPLCLKVPRNCELILMCALAGLRRPESCSHGKQKCERCVERSFSQLNGRRAQKMMTRSCSDSTYNHHSIGPPHMIQHPDLKARVHSVDVSVQFPHVLGPEGWPDGGPTYEDEDYNTPYSCSESGSSQFLLDLGIRACKPKPPTPPKKYTQQEVANEEPVPDSEGSNGDSPVKEDAWKSSHSHCRVGFLLQALSMFSAHKSRPMCAFFQTLC